METTRYQLWYRNPAFKHDRWHCYTSGSLDDMIATSNHIARIYPDHVVSITATGSFPITNGLYVEIRGWQ